MNEKFASMTAQIPDQFRALVKSEPFVEKGVASQKGRAGVYAFFENGYPVHVGRTRNLQGQLRGHINTVDCGTALCLPGGRKIADERLS
jgi:hypothetical protein